MIYKKPWDLFIHSRYYFLILAVVLLFFWPVFKGQIPFPGDLLINENPYKSLSVLGYSPGGYPNKGQGPDVIKEIYPWRYFSLSEFKKGSLPFWNPYNFSGNPQIANFQTGFFYPLNIIYLILPFNYAWTIIIMLEPLLAAIFMYLFLFKGLSLNKFASFIGGIAFGFSSYMTVWIEYGNIGSTILWLPLALLFTKRLYEKLTAVNFASLVTILFLSVLAGYIQGVFYIYTICFLYFTFLLLFGKTKSAGFKKIFVFLISLVFPILLTLFQLLPTLGLFLESTRGAYSLTQISKLLSPLEYWITVLVPDFFGNPATRNYWINGTYIERVMYAGVLITFFAIYGLIHSKSLGKRFFIALCAVSFVITTNIPGIKFLYLLPIPVISTTVPTRELSIFIFSVIVLGAMGIDYWLKEKKYKTKLTIIFVMAYGIIWFLVFLLPGFSSISSSSLAIAKHNLIFPTALALAAVFAFYLKKINKPASLVVITIIVCFDLLYFFNKITPFSPKELIYPKTPVISYLQKNAGINRFWGYGSAYISPNYQSVDGTYSPEGNDPLHIVSYGELLASSKTGASPLILPRPDANVAPGYGPDDLKNNFYRKRILDLLGVKYILHKQEMVDSWLQPDSTTFPQEQFTFAYKVYPWQVYENKGALPRFFIANNYKVESKKEILNSIYDKNTDLNKTVLLEENPGLNINNNSQGEVKLLSYRGNEIKFSTAAKGNSLLFLSDNYYPEWEAYVDGVKTKIYRADYTFRAVVVSKGTHEVIFSYHPANFILGLKISLIGFLLFLISFAGIKRYEKKI